MAVRWAWIGVGALALAAVGVGCNGDIGDGGAGEGEKPKTVSGSLTCDPNLDPSGTPLIRLSQLQYDNTLRDLFGAAMDDATVSAELAQFPVDGEAEDSFSQMDGRVSQRHVDTYYGLADALATLVSSDTTLLQQIAGDCASSPDAACVEDFVRDFGRRAFRRALDEEEVARYMELNGSDSGETFRSMIFVMLMSPQLNYHFEVQGSPIDDREDYLRLSGYELASKLSFHFWQSMPDDELLDAAEDGSLTTDAGYAAQVQRLFAHDRTRRTVSGFYREWYRLGSFAGFAATPAFGAFADGLTVDDELIDAMREEVEALTEHYTWDADGGTYADMLTSNLVFTESSSLATLYGVSPWDGSSSHPTFDGDRAGLLTRAAMLVSANERTNPFKRGSYVKREILCDELAQPDPNQLPPDALTEPEVDPQMSTRERFAAKTSPGECQACHSAFNPIGFAFEAYDGLGRFRTDEDIFAEDGSILATVPVDTAVEARIGDERVELDGPLELMDEVVASGKTETCFARHYFRFTYRRHETDEIDGCSMVAVREALLNGSGLRGALEAIALEPAFRVRVIKDEEVQP